MSGSDLVMRSVKIPREMDALIREGGMNFSQLVREGLERVLDDRVPEATRGEVGVMSSPATDCINFRGLECGMAVCSVGIAYTGEAERVPLPRCNKQCENYYKMRD